MTRETSKSNSSRPVPTVKRPWLGLHSYTEDNPEFFFGRDAEIRDIFVGVRDQTLTILYGQSGWGKSSLLSAGLIPKLKVERYRPVLIRLNYSDDALSLIEQTKIELHKVAPNLPYDSENSLWELFHRNTSETSDSSKLPDQNELSLEEAPPVIIFDQFEEIFTLGSTRKEQRAQWFQQIADLVENSPPEELQERLRQNRELRQQYSYDLPPVRVVISLRHEYLSALEGWKEVLPSLMCNRMALHPLRGPQAMEAVVRPGLLGEHPIVSEKVAAQIVRQAVSKDSGETNDSEPDVPLEEIEAVPPYFLSLLCEQLNAERLHLGQDEITLDLVALRGKHIFRQYYENSFKDLPGGVRSCVEDVLVSDGGHRNAVAREDLLRELDGAGVSHPEHHLDELIKRRLLTMETRGGQQRVELTHDRLAELITPLKEDRAARESRIIEMKKRAFWVKLLGLTALGCAIFSGFTFYSWSRAENARRDLDRIVVGTRQGIERSSCSHVLNTSPKECEPYGRNPQREVESCTVPFVTFDPKDREAYNAVACKFWETHGIRVRHISCNEDAFHNYRNVFMKLYPGGVLSWAPGQPTEEFKDDIFKIDVDAWNIATASTLEPVKSYLNPDKLVTEHLYAIPFKFYPWAIYFNKKVIRQSISEDGPYAFFKAPAKGSKEWTVPDDWDQLLATAKEMKSRGISPFAFSFNKENEWTANGIVDILDVRLHGFDAHTELMKGKEGRLTKQLIEKQLTEIFEKWAFTGLKYHFKIIQK